MKRIAIVTGGNKGIGFGIVRGLAKEFKNQNVDVYLTARDEKRGLEAVKKLTDEEGLSVHFHQLDITDKASIEKLRDFCQEKYGGLDILVNNAAMAFRRGSSEPMIHQAEVTLKTNYWGIRETCDILFPILKKGARVVQVSSFLGHLHKLNGVEPQAGELRGKLSSDSLTVKELDDLVKQYVEDVRNGVHKDKGWPKASNYGLSKIFMSALSRIQQREFDEKPELDLVINHINPGWVSTDMSRQLGPLTIDEGAVSSIYAATLPPLTEIRGKYLWHDKREIDWVNGPVPSFVKFVLCSLAKLAWNKLQNVNTSLIISSVLVLIYFLFFPCCDHKKED